MEEWGTPRITMHGATNELTVYEAYAQFVGNLATMTQESDNIYRAQEITVNRASNERSQVSGVSMDEETANMLKYQYAYRAAARILTVVDSMLDKLINGTGRAGL
jgi:flagellar hook-associated protein 1 FlgK